eukprot:485766_1
MLANQTEDDDDKIEEKVEEASFKTFGLHQFFNLKESTPNLYDLRPADQYKKSHVDGATNIPEPKKLDKFGVVPRVLYHCPIVVYGDKRSMPKGIIDHLWELIQAIGKDISLYVFDGDYMDIYRAYPFLCDNKMVTYPNMILEDELFLGDGMMAESKDVMIDLGITHIVCVTKSFFTLDKDVKKNIKYLKLPIDDSVMEADTMATYFETASKFMDDALIYINNNRKKNNRVFVHCMVGVSRSASIVISYLMKSRKYTLCDAYIHVKRCRQGISPNQGFLSRLIAYEKQLFGKSTEKELTKALTSKAYAL